MAISTTLQFGDGRHQEIILASAYLPGEDPVAPTDDVIGLIRHCKANNKKLVLGCDANAHHTAWGSSNVNTRGESLLDFIFSENLEIVNKGRTPTFVTANRAEVLDVTLSTYSAFELIKDWRVSERASLSDHRHIIFEFRAPKPEIRGSRVPKSTDWDGYLACLATNLEPLGDLVAGSEPALDHLADSIREGIIQAYHESCPERVRKTSRDLPWWNERLGRLRRDARRLFNRAKRNGDWASYRAALTGYNRELRESKRKSWRGFCEGIEDLPTATRLQKVLSREHSNGVGTLRLDNGLHTSNGRETITELLSAHFPGSTTDLGGVATRISLTRRPKWYQATAIFTPKRVEDAIGSFGPYKSPGADGVFPALLQRGADLLVPLLTRAFRSSYALTYIPAAWRRARVVFIPKAGNRPPDEAKSYRPISLTSFLLKTMERILDEHIKEGTLRVNPLNGNQHAYLSGRSTVTALHDITARLEDTLRRKEVALCAFMDIKGAFDKVPIRSIALATERKGVDRATAAWIDTMLRNRQIEAELGADKITVLAERGCPQGGVLSPLLWLLVVDELLDELSGCGVHVQAYADDVAVIAAGKDTTALVGNMQMALDKVVSWCDRTGLTVNPGKTVVVPFTTKRKLDLTQLTLRTTTLQYSEEVKYLGLHLDRKLSWNSHVTHALDKATRALWACRRLFGRTWGLKPDMVYWLYTTVIRPTLTYGALVWWKAAQRKTIMGKLQKLQRLACLGITGATRTCPTAALERLVDLTPLHIFVQKEALSAAMILHVTGRMSRFGSGHREVLEEIPEISMAWAPTDIMVKRRQHELPFEVNIPTRECWGNGGPRHDPFAMYYYTDGSRTGEGVGLGIYGIGVERSIPLGGIPTIFQAEVMAITTCAEIARQTRNRSEVHILSDSQAAIKALSSTEVKSKTVWECLRSLRGLSRQRKVHITWIPGHNGHEGNERADGLAKQGAERPYMGPEPACGIPRSLIGLELRDWEKRMSLSYWNSLRGHRQSKELMGSRTGQCKGLRAGNKSQIRTLTGLLTGHGRINYHLRKIGLTQDDTCRLCREDIETSAHILCECEALAGTRRLSFGMPFLEAKEVRQLNPDDVLRFARISGLGWI